MGNINVHIPDELHIKAKGLALKLKMTMIEFVNQAIEEKVKSEEAQPITQGTEPVVTQ